MSGEVAQLQLVVEAPADRQHPPHPDCLLGDVGRAVEREPGVGRIDNRPVSGLRRVGQQDRRAPAELYSQLGEVAGVVRVEPLPGDPRGVDVSIRAGAEEDAGILDHEQLLAGLGANRGSASTFTPNRGSRAEDLEPLAAGADALRRPWPPSGRSSHAIEVRGSSGRSPCRRLGPRWKAGAERMSSTNYGSTTWIGPDDEAALRP